MSRLARSEHQKVVAAPITQTQPQPAVRYPRQHGQRQAEFNAYQNIENYRQSRRHALPRDKSTQPYSGLRTSALIWLILQELGLKVSSSGDSIIVLLDSGLGFAVASVSAEAGLQLSQPFVNTAI